MTITATTTGVDAIYRRIEGPLSLAQVPIYRSVPPRPLEGTGSVFVVVKDGGKSRPSGPYLRSLLRPVIGVQVWADATRDDDALILRHDAESKALAVFEFLAPLLDTLTPWPGVVACEQYSGPEIFQVPDAVGPVLLSSAWAVDLNNSRPGVAP